MGGTEIPSFRRGAGGCGFHHQGYADEHQNQYSHGLQVRGVVPDQLLLQMLVSWLGPLPENAKKLKTAHGKKRPAAPLATIATEDGKPAVGAKKHRPPLKASLLSFSLQLIPYAPCSPF